MNPLVELLINCVDARLCVRATRDFDLMERMSRIEQRLRGQLPPSVPKRVAASALGVSVPGLERWLDRGAIALVQSESSSRHRVETTPLLVILCEVVKLREDGHARPLGEAIDKLRLRLPGEPVVLRAEIAALPRVNPSVHELRHDFLTSTPAQRLSVAGSLSQMATRLAVAGERAMKRQHA